MQRDSRVQRRSAIALVDLLLRLLTAAGLALDAGVHASLARLYDGVGGTLSEGDLFRIEAALACLVALCVLATRWRPAFVAAALVGLSAIAVLLVSRYVDLGAIGPIPNLYEPAWDVQKSLAAAGEIATVLASSAWLVLARRNSQQRKEPIMPLSRSTSLVGVGIAGVLVAAGMAAGITGGVAARGASPSPRGYGHHAALQHVTIVGNNQLRFAPSTVHLRPGKVRITLKDAGAYPHNLVIPALRFTSTSVTGDPGGTVVSFTVGFPHKGRYRFYCAYHQSAGMVGTFVVS